MTYKQATIPKYTIRRVDIQESDHSCGQNLACMFLGEHVNRELAQRDRESIR